MKCYELTSPNEYLRTYKVTRSTRTMATKYIYFSIFNDDNTMFYKEIPMPREIRCLALLLGITPIKPKTAPEAFQMYKEVG